MKKKILTVLLALVMLANCISFAAMAEEEPIFPDLNIHAWYYSAVEFVYKNNILSGTGKYFEPDKEMSRAMLVTAIYRLEGATADSKNAFVDVPDNAWYAPAVTWASENGIVNGTDKTHFSPNTNLTREQLAAIMYRYAEMKGVTDNRGYSMLEFYEDRDEMSPYATVAIDFMIKQGFMNGKTRDTFNPKDTTTRAEVALVITLFARDILKMDTYSR